MVSIIPIVPKFPHVTIEVLDNHGLMDGVRVDVNIPVMMLVTSDLKICSTPVPLTVRG
jgi:hypothetical protein